MTRDLWYPHFCPYYFFCWKVLPICKTGLLVMATDLWFCHRLQVCPFLGSALFPNWITLFCVIFDLFDSFVCIDNKQAKPCNSTFSQFFFVLNCYYKEAKPSYLTFSQPLQPGWSDYWDCGDCPCGRGEDEITRFLSKKGVEGNSCDLAFHIFNFRQVGVICLPLLFCRASLLEPYSMSPSMRSSSTSSSLSSWSPTSH